MLNNDRLLFLISTLPSSADKYKIAAILEHDFSNSFAYSMISGKLDKIKLSEPFPEYMIFLNILTIISAGMILPAATMLRNSKPIDVFLSFSSLMRELTSRLVKPRLIS